MVGNAIASKLVELGYEVKMGSRTANNEKALAWLKGKGGGASEGSFADAAAFGEILFNCTVGAASLEALKLAGSRNLRGKILIDVANPLDFSQGMPPSLTVCNKDSLAEQIQRSFPEARVVKALNTMNCTVMVNPAIVPGDHTVFVSGNDAKAKTEVTKILNQFGWKNVIDLGDITSARGTEMLLALWLRLMAVLQTTNFNFIIAK